MKREASFPSLVDSSMLSSAGCHRQFFFKYCLNLASMGTNVHLHAGGALAYGVQKTREAFYRDGKSELEAVYEGFEAYIERYGDFEPPDFGTGKFKDFINVGNAFFSYFRQYPLASDEIQPYRRDNGDPAVEFTFAIPLPIEHPDTGEPIFYGGRSDMVGVWNRQNAVVDEKTTYVFGDNWTKQFLLRGQFIGYCWAGQQSGMDTSAAIVRGIGIQQSGTKHLEARFLYPQWQIDRWYKQMLLKVQGLANSYKGYKESLDLDSLPMSYGDACTAYSGCEMIDLCTSEHPENWYDSYGERNWNPLAMGA